MIDAPIRETWKMACKQNARHRLAIVLRSRPPLLYYGELVLRPLARDEQGEASPHKSHVASDRLSEARG